MRNEIWASLIGKFSGLFGTSKHKKGEKAKMHIVSKKANRKASRKSHRLNIRRGK